MSCRCGSQAWELLGNKSTLSGAADCPCVGESEVQARVRGPPQGAHREPLAAAISGSLCDSRGGEGAGSREQRRSRGEWGGGAEGGARRGGRLAEPGRASCAPARGPAVASGRSPRPAADPGCRWAWRRGRKDARGVCTPSPSPAGVLGSAAGLARPGNPETLRRLGLRSGAAPYPLWPTVGPVVRTRAGRRRRTAELGRGGGGSSSRCAAWAGATGPGRRGAHPERRRHLQRPRARRRRWSPRTQHSRKTRQGLIGPYSQAKKRTRILCLQGLTGSLGQSCRLAEKIRKVLVPTLPLSTFCLCPQRRGCLTLLLGTGPVASHAGSGGDHKCWRAKHLGLSCRQDGDGLKSCFLHHQTLPTSDCPAEPPSLLAICQCQKLFSRKEPVNTLILKS
ncbi:uncharacterized protein LOC129558963 [Moschus berezovskii]|uniref:uncharacterized protein LOC129558963 n=1 Tax=Moschus berezovskii TaxID=68408 RepID=UPI002444B62B|nr:uncharacterized protein LOC129558963 [Moschus berezovskii]